MVQVTSAEILANAKPFVNDVISKNSLSDEGPILNQDFGLPAIFGEVFKENEELMKIPLLNLCSKGGMDNLDGRLVRFLCYSVHSDLEIFAGAYKSRDKAIDDWI